MNKQELIDAVAAQTGASKSQTGETLDTLPLNAHGVGYSAIAH